MYIAGSRGHTLVVGVLTRGFSRVSTDSDIVGREGYMMSLTLW